MQMKRIVLVVRMDVSHSQCDVSFHLTLTGFSYSRPIPTDVFDILIKYKEFRKKKSEFPWKDAIMAVLPQRKGAKFVADKDAKSKK